MNLARDGREFATWTVKSKAALVDPPQVQFTPPPVAPATVGVPSAWIVTAWDGAATVDSKDRSVRACRLLVAGPDAPHAQAVALVVGTTKTRIRVIGDPEQIPRDTDPITVG